MTAIERTFIIDVMDEYLRSTDVIDCDAKPILEKAGALTEGLETSREKAMALFYFVRDGIKHEPYAAGYVPEDYKASGTLKKGDGFCTHKAILLVALARATGIPARLGFADIRDHLLSYKFRKLIGGENLLIYHGYAELFVEGNWVHASPAYDLQKCQRNGFVPVEFDGVNDAKDSPCDQKGRPHIEYVLDHGHYADFPWDMLVEEGQKFWAGLGLSWSESVGKWWSGEGARSDEPK
ncbi:MAG: transglutaminase family protein [Dehalococcoidia bacterium]